MSGGAWIAPGALPGIESLPAPGAGRGLSLGPSEVHVWYTPFSETWDKELLLRYRAVMTQAERARCDRFVFERDRVQFAITRALVRGALSRYAAVAPEDWRFVENSHGKPAIDGEATPGARSGDAARLFFNVSNTRDLVVCAITRMTPEIGIDTEKLDRAPDVVGIADRYFSPAEVRALMRCPAAERGARFFAYWTLKEAYIKARGMGLALPLAEFSFDLDDPRAIAIGFSPSLEDAPESWSFWLGHLAQGHYVAVAVRAAPGAKVALLARSWVPLTEP